MHILTITLHSNLFGTELDDEVLEEIAREIYKEFHSLAVEKGISKDITVKAYWQRGCVIEHLQIFVENPELAFGVASGVSIAVIQATMKYKKLKENLEEIASDLKKFTKKVGGIPVSIWDSLVSMTKPPIKAEELSLVPIETDEEQDRRRP